MFSLKQLALVMMMIFLSSSHAFMPTPLLKPQGGKGSFSSADKRAAIMKREVIPQLIFAGACAGAVFGYVFTHIDEIKAKQKVAVERTMKQQANDLRNTQAAQRDAIDAALKKQDEAIRKINEEAKKRAEDAARRR